MDEVARSAASPLLPKAKEGPTGWALIAGNTLAQFLVAAAAS